MIRASTRTPDRKQVHRNRRAFAAAMLVPALLVAALLDLRPAEIDRPSAESTGSGVTDSQTRAGSRCGEPHFRPARVDHRFTPDYPLEAYAAREQGSVDVIVDVSANGEVTNSRLYQSSGSQALDDAAVAGALKYTFKPARRDGKPTQAQGIVTIDWTIGPDVVRHFKEMGESQPDVARKIQCLRDSQRHGGSLQLCQDASGEYHRRK